ncbi:MAG: CheB methylesterase domain-containing protein [Pirellulaceae bacterium]
MLGRPSGRPPVAATNSSKPILNHRSERCSVVLIGSSTGGPNALFDIFSSIPASFPLPILIVQHMPQMFTQMLAERLNRASGLNIQEATDGAQIRPGHVWVAPGGKHMSVVGTLANPTIAITDEAPENSCKPSVDRLFRSAANVYGNEALAVVLTGMGTDGALGCGALKSRGAKVIAQDRESCIVWGMPRAVFEAGHADRVAPLSEIPALIAQSVAGSSKTPSIVAQ